MLERDIALIDELCSGSAESACVEFKKDNVDPKLIAKLCSALSNSARIEQQSTAYILWGIRNDDRKVIGTQFDPDAEIVGNQVFQLWLAQRLSPGIAFSFRSIEHHDGKVVILEIPAATIAPVALDSIQYVRVGSATTKLSNHPELFAKFVNNISQFVWEKGIAKDFLSVDELFELIDFSSYFKLTKQRLPNNHEGILDHLETDQLIIKDIGGRWKISNLGAILFANDLRQFSQSIARKAIRFVAYDGKNKASTVTHRTDGTKGYAIGLEGLIGYIDNLLPQNEHIGSVFRRGRRLYPEIAIRELVANALIHQDMTITGAGPHIELFADRLEITNPGSPLVEVDRMIDLPPRSRNEALASLMRRMDMCEEQGGGLDKVIVSVELYQMPAPKFQDDSNAMQVILYAPRSFAHMTVDERVRACYQHAVIQHLSGERMKNASLCERLGIESRNASQASGVINAALKEGVIQVADLEHPRAGYLPWWAK